MDIEPTDSILLKILQERGSIAGFLTAISNFLKRNTEFYCEKKLETIPLKRHDEKLIAALQLSETSHKYPEQPAIAANVGHENAPPAVEEVEVETECELEQDTNKSEMPATPKCNAISPPEQLSVAVITTEVVSPTCRPHKLRKLLPKSRNIKQSHSAPANRNPATSIAAVATVKKRRLYTCSECPESFVSFRQLKMHEGTHITHADGISICNYCCSLYANAEKLDKHVVDCHTNCRYFCLPCAKSYKSRGQLLKHVRSECHNASALLYYCSLCPRSSKSVVEFTTRTALQQHYQEMHLLMPTSQEEDDVEIEMNEEFLDEFLLHNGNENSFHFSECWDALDLHLPDMLPLPSTGESCGDEQNLTPDKCSFKCPKCFESCANQKILLQHLAQKHLLQVLICGKCELSFQDYTKWLQHKSTHRRKSAGTGTTTNDKLQCDICDKTFRTNAALNYHVKTHSRNTLRPHECPYCGKSFHTDINFKQHLRIVHSQTKRHTCELCDKQFATLDHLKKHVLSQHQNERKHICHVCAKRFTQLSHLKQHLSIHTTGKTLKCNSCDAMFWRKIDLQRHTLSKHV